jgi:glycosyltransferase involved in cell wall biosynthesis
MTLRLLTTLVGDVRNKADMRAKYGTFFGALAQRVELAGHYDASLRGAARYWNAARSFGLPRTRWKERSFRNEPAFRMRSEMCVRYIRQMHPSPDVVLQLGVLFDSTWADSPVPVVLYTDNTSAITARHPAAGRHAFNTREQADWMALEKECYRRAMHICVRAAVVQRSLVADYNIPAEKITVIGGGVNYTPLPVLPYRDLSRAPSVLFVGRDFRRKGGDLVLKAFVRARPQCPDARLLVVTGERIPSGLPMAGVQQLDIGWDREALASLYQRADLFILPSRQETWGDVLLEAMAFGLPCIGVTGQAMEEIIQPGVTGELAPPEDVGALAGALTSLLVDRTLRVRMGQAARTRAETQFTWEQVVERLFPILIDARK